MNIDSTAYWHCVSTMRTFKIAQLKAQK